MREVTGYAIGGVPPAGHPEPIDTLVDRDLLSLGELWAAAGTPQAVFPIEPDGLPRLTGGKRFITNAGIAQLYTVFAKTDSSAGHSGISAFVVEADSPGFEVGRIEPKMGIKGSTTGEVFFNDCRVPAANLLGEEGEGFRIAMRILDRSRPVVVDLRHAVEGDLSHSAPPPPRV